MSKQKSQSVNAMLQSFRKLERKATDEVGWIALKFSVSRAVAERMIADAAEPPKPMPRITPGDWFADGCKVLDMDCTVITVCRQAAPRNTMEARANAVAMAAVPKMLEACRDALEVLTVAIEAGCDDPDTAKAAVEGHATLKKLRAAIHKATATE